MTFDELIADLDSDGFGHYLAGLIDGEGSFVIGTTNPGAYSCRFRIRLRDDDAAILYLCHERTCLGLVRPEKAYDTQRPNTKPQMCWFVQTKADCATLVRLLERYPLRAKKRGDFEIWRFAVREWCAKTRHGNWDTMVALRAQLNAGRQYNAPDEALPANVVDLQLRLNDQAA